MGPKIVKKASFAPRVLHTKRGETVLDFGQNMTGWVELDVNEPAGTEIVLTYGEVLQDECFYRDNLRTAKAEYRYVSNGKPAHVRPHFTFYGFRYVKVEGVTQVRFGALHRCAHPLGHRRHRLHRNGGPPGQPAVPQRPVGPV